MSEHGSDNCSESGSDSDSDSQSDQTEVDDSPLQKCMDRNKQCKNMCLSLSLSISRLSLGLGNGFSGGCVDLNKPRRKLFDPEVAKAAILKGGMQPVRRTFFCLFVIVVEFFFVHWCLALQWISFNVSSKKAGEWNLVTRILSLPYIYLSHSKRSSDLWSPDSRRLEASFCRFYCPDDPFTTNEPL